MAQYEKGIQGNTGFCAGGPICHLVDIAVSKSTNRLVSCAAYLVVITMLFLPHSVFAQQSLVIDLNVFGLNSNQDTAGQQLDSACQALANDSSAAAQDLKNTCALISSLDENDPDDVQRLQEILDAVGPEEAFSMNDSIVYISDYQTTNVYSRINALRTTSPTDDSEDEPEEVDQSAYKSDPKVNGLQYSVVYPMSGGGAAAGDLLSRLGIFFTGQLSAGDVDGSTFEQDADINSSSFTTGADYRIRNNVVAGIGLGAMQNKTEFTNVDGSTETQGFNLTAFASWYQEGQGHFDAVLDFGSNSYDLERSIGTSPGTPVLALSSTDSSAVSFTISGGRNFDVGAWDLGGYFRLSLTSATIDGYTETASNGGAGSGSVFSVGSQSVDSTTMVFGAEASRVINTRRAVLIPVIRVEYETENEKKKEDLNATLVTSQVTGTYRGTDRDTGYANLGIGGSAVFKNGRSAYAFYETHLQHDFVTQNWLKFGLRLEF